MTTTIRFVTDEPSPTVSEALGALIGRTVDIEIPDNTGYPAENVHVCAVDGDGDLVVCETDDQGIPLQGSTWAIPQTIIETITCPLGDSA